MIRLRTGRLAERLLLYFRCKLYDRNVNRERYNRRYLAENVDKGYRPRRS